MADERSATAQRVSSPSLRRTIATVEIRPLVGPVKTIDLTVGELVRIGRVPENDVVLNDAKVSRFHAVLNVAETGVVISDLSSLNGTFVSGRRIQTPTPLQSGDTISIGDALLSIELAAGVVPSRDDLSTQTQVGQLRSVVVTILVADVCGYTVASETLPPRDVAMALQRWFELVSDTVSKYGGEVNKFLGDAVMAIWQSDPEKAPEAARSAVCAAATILRETPRHVERTGWAYEREHPWACRVCLNTGEALQGVFGERRARDFTVLGDSINVAFRLESIAKQLGHSFIVSGATAELIRESTCLTPLGPATLKGKSEPIEIFGVTVFDECSPRASRSE